MGMMPSLPLSYVGEGAAHSGDFEGTVPLILYSPVSWLLLLLRMLNADDAFDPTVSTLSNPGDSTLSFTLPAADPGREFSS